jgi:hypothetical protein
MTLKPSNQALSAELEIKEHPEHHQATYPASR